MPDQFSSYRRGLSDPPENGRAVTPNDSQDLPDVARGLYVGTAGNVAVILKGDADNAPVTFWNVPAGTTLGWSIRRVLATGTSAQNMIAGW